MFDIQPAVRRTGIVVTSIADDQLELPTPCPRSNVGDLLDHVGLFAVRFRAAARKEAGNESPPAPPNGDNLEPGWRGRLSDDLEALADAWSDPEAWEGTAFAGGMELPAHVVALVALDELVVHGWDLAVATSQPYEPAVDDVEAALGFVTSFDVPRDGTLFGPVVPVADDAPPLARLLGMTGRDPAWRPTSSNADDRA